MAAELDANERFFKTAWFAKAARKAHIDDAELCTAIRQVLLGQADDLGGGVYKKRLNKICIAASSLRVAAGTGFTRFSSPSKTRPTSMLTI